MQLLCQLRSLPALKNLDLSSCWRVSDAGLIALMKATPAVEKAILSKVWKLTDASLALMPQCWRMLQVLVLGASTASITAAGGLLPILRGCSKLTALRLSQCCISAAEWDAVVCACSEPAVMMHLTLLDVSASPTLTEAAMESFLAARRTTPDEHIAPVGQGAQRECTGMPGFTRPTLRLRATGCPLLVNDADLQAAALRGS